MADTMTLTEVRDLLGMALAHGGSHISIHRPPARNAYDAIDAAIRERDRLRGDVSGMTEELLHVPSREEWRALQKRAERAEAELAALKNENAQLRDVLADRDMDREMAAHAHKEIAALKARIAEAPVATLVYGQSDMLSVLSAENADDWAGKQVRLLVVEE